MSVDRGFTWMEDETILLIGIFSRADIQEELRGAKRNITVYEKIAGELSAIGFSRTAYQCREKIKRLRKEYQHIQLCMLNNLKPKKPMKHYDLVDSIFSCNNSSEQINISDQNMHNSENEEELQSFTHDKESDASNSFPSNEQIYPQSILPVSSPLPELDCEDSNMLMDAKLANSPLMPQTDSDNTIFLNGEQSYDLSDKDSALDEIDSPWVPNVVLVENDSMQDDDVEHSSDNVDNDETKAHEFCLSEEKYSISDTAMFRSSLMTFSDKIRLNGKLHIVLIGSKRDCKVCSIRNEPGKRKQTVYYCDTCLDKPRMHLGECFIKYHTRRKYRT